MKKKSIFLRPNGDTDSISCLLFQLFKHIRFDVGVSYSTTQCSGKSTVILYFIRFPYEYIYIICYSVIVEHEVYTYKKEVTRFAL